jgi:hypothetical protein
MSFYPSTPGFAAMAGVEDEPSMAMMSQTMMAMRGGEEAGWRGEV